MNHSRLLAGCVCGCALLASACNEGHTQSHMEKESQAEKIIEQQPVEIKEGLLTPELLWNMGRVGDLKRSPDGNQLLYSVQYYDLALNKGNKDWYTLSVHSADATTVKPQRITRSSLSEQSMNWQNEGKYFYFLSDESGSMQLYRMDLKGEQRQQLSEVDGGIDDYLLSPDGKNILYMAQVSLGGEVASLYPDLPLSSGKIIKDLMYKHWDEWVTRVPHPFVAELTSDGIGQPKDLLAGEPYESPMKPWGGMEQWAWSKDSRRIYYTCRKLTGKEYALSTHSDIYEYDLETGNAVNLTRSGGENQILPFSSLEIMRAGRTVTTQREGYNQNPVISLDGRYMAYESMERDGYESDWNRLWVYDFKQQRHYWLGADFDGDVSSICWADDSQTLYFISSVATTLQVFKTDVLTGRVEQVTDGMFDLSSPVMGKDNNGLYALCQSMIRPPEVYRISLPDGKLTAITDENKFIYSQLRLPKVEKCDVPTSDRQSMLTWVVYPPDFDPQKKYPAVLFCTGGPQGNNGQFWSYRWNLSLMASKGYIVVLPNRRGVSGVGQAWKEQISGDYVGQNMQDYLSAVDYLSQKDYIDENRWGCVGASYGGYSVYWLAGNHHKRFKAFIAHSGIFNVEAQYLETEEMWFENFDVGGPYWDKSNAKAQRYYDASPHLYIDKWDTPILCIHGEKDYRILYNQAMQAFNAAILRGVDAELLVFPDENHWISKPQNSVLWQRRFFNWLDTYLK